MVFSQTKFILESLGQDPQVAHYAHLYVNTYLPGLYLLGQFDMLRKFLNCLQKNTVPLKAIAIGQVFHVFWSWLFVIKYEYGVVGTGYAGVISNGSILIICLIYTSMLEDIKEGVFWPDSRSFTGIQEYL
jgi:multidrug resistance protein, MATE family